MQHRPENWAKKVSCGCLVLAVGVWYCTSSTRELSHGCSRHGCVWWAIGLHRAVGLGDLDTFGSGGITGNCGASLGTLGEATSSKMSPVSVACWKGVTCVRWTGVCSTNASNGGGNHVVAPGASLLPSFCSRAWKGLLVWSSAGVVLGRLQCLGVGEAQGRCNAQASFSNGGVATGFHPVWDTVLPDLPNFFVSVIP